MEAWKADSIRWIDRINATSANDTINGSWLKNEGQCRFCSYQAICISCADPQIIEQLYEKHDSEAYLKNGDEA